MAYDIEVKLYKKYLPELREFFTLRSNFTDLAKSRVDRALKGLLDEGQKPVLVGVHVRRTDYKGILRTFHKTKPLETEYFTKAMDYYRTKYNRSGTKVLFLVTSDEMAWVRQYLVGQNQDIIPIGTHGDRAFEEAYGYNGSVGTDLAVLVSCDHMIMTYGTFGVWAGLLAGGEVLMADEYGAQGSAKDIPGEVEDMKLADLPGWKFLSTKTWEIKGRDLI